MRMLAIFALVLAGGYVLFADQNRLPGPGAGSWAQGTGGKGGTGASSYLGSGGAVSGTASGVASGLLR